MSRPSNAPSSDASVAPQQGSAEETATSLTNFLLLALHQVLLRIGWIFKTESIVIPAFVDFIGGGAALRGWLPMLNRFGFSVPPVLFARTLKLTRRKKFLVAATTFSMALPFAVLSAIWYAGVWRDADGSATAWMPYAFLFLYGIFFCITGLNQLGANTLQGKLVRPNLRGRLFTTALIVGAPLAILAAATLLPDWLRQSDGGFGNVFAFTALAFMLAAVVVSLADERPDNYCEPEARPWRRFQDAYRVVARDPDARRLATLAILFSSTFTMFPHYQSFARPDAQSDLRRLVAWVCVQNAATASIGLFAGPMADRRGNRSALRFSVFGASLAPLAALMLGSLPVEIAARYDWAMFVPLGFTPVAIRFLVNYALEITIQEEHPRMVSAVGVCLAAPVMLLSPLAGLLVAYAGFYPLFLLGFAALLAAGGQTLRLAEPRNT